MMGDCLVPDDHEYDAYEEDVHHCHAEGCTVACRPEYLMCGRHWAAVPNFIQRAVYKHYQPGQCDGDFTPSENWHRAADAAIAAVAVIEGKPVRKKGLTELLRINSKYLPWSLVTKLEEMKK